MYPQVLLTAKILGKHNMVEDIFTLRYDNTNIVGFALEDISVGKEGEVAFLGDHLSYMYGEAYKLFKLFLPELKYSIFKTLLENMNLRLKL